MQRITFETAKLAKKKGYTKLTQYSWDRFCNDKDKWFYQLIRNTNYPIQDYSKFRYVII